jgi:ABC-2 type transport system permease protein
VTIGQPPQQAGSFSMLSLRPRSRWRKAADTVTAYLRIDIIEDAIFPATTIMGYVAIIFPVLMYFFQAKYLGRPDAYASTIVGVSIGIGLQDALAGLTNRLMFAQERGTLETYLVEPVSWTLIPLAMNVWRSLTGMITACLMLFIAWCLGAEFNLANAPLALLVLLLGVAAVNAVGVLAASFLVLFKRGGPVLSVYGLIAAFIGGTLFSISVLPPYIRWASYLVPHSYVISAERALLVPGQSGEGPSVLTTVAALIVFCCIAYFVGLRLFARALDRARALGVLAT